MSTGTILILLFAFAMVAMHLFGHRGHGGHAGHGGHGGGCGGGHAHPGHGEDESQPSKPPEPQGRGNAPPPGGAGSHAGHARA